MAKIEIKNSIDNLQRVATFLRKNNIKFDMVNDYGSTPVKEADGYQKLKDKLGL